MTNYVQNRNNMILGQFLPGLIKDKKLLEVFEEVPREKFLPSQFKAVAYSDLNIKINTNRYIPSPFNSAKIFQEASFLGKEVVLLIGATYGYEALILSKMVDTLVAIEEDVNLVKSAEAAYKSLNVENVVLFNKTHESGYKKLGPYDTIINLDTRFKIEKELLNQLTEGGKLFCCENHNFNLKESKLNVFYKFNNNYVKQKLFDINIPTVIEDKVNKDQFSLI